MTQYKQGINLSESRPSDIIRGGEVEEILFIDCKYPTTHQHHTI